MSPSPSAERRAHPPADSLNACTSGTTGGQAGGPASPDDLMMPPPGGAQPSVNRALTPRPRRRVTENDEYTAFLRRVLRAYARRVGRGDIDALADMAALAGELENVMRQAVTGLRKTGYSWADIAARLSITRQGAQQRWGGSDQQ